MTEEIEQLNHKNLGTLGEMETYEYLGILKVNTIKQAGMKGNN